jgi:TM2 domain-containing membrane protein YozV
MYIGKVLSGVCVALVVCVVFCMSFFVLFPLAIVLCHSSIYHI